MPQGVRARLSERGYVCVPRSTRTYGAATGLPAGYVEADGIQSSTSYNVDGRPVAVSDGKGSQALSYHAETGDLTQVLDLGAGTFSAAYDADGRVTSQVYPGGIAVERTYDNGRSGLTAAMGISP